MDLASDITEVASPADTALILICDKCGKKLNPDQSQNPATLLQQSLKMEIKQNNLKGKVRAVSSSCLDICPENKIAIGISYGQGKGDSFFTLTPNSINELKDEILRLSQSKSKP